MCMCVYLCMRVCMCVYVCMGLCVRVYIEVIMQDKRWNCTSVYHLH